MARQNRRQQKPTNELGEGKLLLMESFLETAEETAELKKQIAVSAARQEQQSLHVQLARMEGMKEWEKKEKRKNLLAKLLK
jgi:hypothetical protein